MKNLPKLKVKEGLGWESTEEMRDFEQAKFFPFGSDLVVVIEGQIVGSYDELVKLVSEGKFDNKESLEVMFLPIIVGG